MSGQDFWQWQDSDYETRTRALNWPWFLLVESGDDTLAVTKLSPFPIDKGFQALMPGRPRSIKRLANGAFLVECDTKKQSDLLLKSKRLVDRPVKVSTHPTLNSSRGVIRCCDLSGLLKRTYEMSWVSREWHWSSVSGERNKAKKRTQIHSSSSSSAFDVMTVLNPQASGC